jgi:hypothetical protein
MVLLTGCAGTVYRTDLEVYCPPMKTYSDEYNAKLAGELDALPSASTAIDTAITDYVALRDRIRACKTERENL